GTVSCRDSVSSAFRAALSLLPFPTRRSSDLHPPIFISFNVFWSVSLILYSFIINIFYLFYNEIARVKRTFIPFSINILLTLAIRSDEHTSELQSRFDLVCRLLPDNKNDSRAR